MNTRSRLRSLAPRLAHRTFAFVAAAIATGAAAALIQTQVNLAEVVALGAPVRVVERITTSLEDLARIGPVLAGIAAVGLLPALLLGFLCSAVGPVLRTPMLVLGGLLGLWFAFQLLGVVTPMRALVSATRASWGLWAVCASGALGGAVYGRLVAREAAGVPRKSAWYYVGGVIALILAPAIAFIGSAPRAASSFAVTDPASYTVETVASGLQRPWSVAFLPDGRVLITEMAGRLLALDRKGERQELSVQPALDVYVDGAATGLMEVAVDPDFVSNGLIYLTMGYGKKDENGTRVARGRFDGVGLVEVKTIFDSTLKTGRGNNGGRMAFLPDGSFVLTLGDGSDQRELAQRLTSHQGKTVRLDRDGKAPIDNPFVGSGSAAPELYSLGHRNAQGIAFDAVTATLFSTEHGPRGGDEINVIRPGVNYGWPLASGGIDYSYARVTPFKSLKGYEGAVLQWSPSIAPSGLAVYRGEMFRAWQGSLLVPALKERSLRRVYKELDGSYAQELLLTERRERIRDVKVAPDGSLYVLTDGLEARLLRLRANATD